MSVETKYVTTAGELKADGEEGTVTCVFSTFHVRDRGDDIVEPSALKDGQVVPMTWGHDWSRPCGAGVVRVGRDRAEFHGRFNLKTSWGRDAYEAVKFAGPAQQYSWGFKVTDSEHGQVDGEPVRYIKGAEVFEVSPVLVGEGLGTRTLSLKHLEAQGDDDEAKATWSYSYVRDLPSSAFAVTTADGQRMFPHHDAQGNVDLPHLRNALARLPQANLSAADRAKAAAHLEAHARAAGIGDRGKGIPEPWADPLPFDDHADAVLEALAGLAARARARAEMRAKQGRQISGTNAGALRAIVERLRSLATDIDDFLTAAGVPEPDDQSPAKGQPPPDLFRLALEFESLKARHRAGLAH